MLFLVPRALVADLGASFAAVRDACPTSRRVESPETQLRDEWRTRGVPYQAYPFAATLLRNEGHLDCGYFRHTALDLFGSSRGRAGGAVVVARARRPARGRQSPAHGRTKKGSIDSKLLYG